MSENYFIESVNVKKGLIFEKDLNNEHQNLEKQNTSYKICKF